MDTPRDRYQRLLRGVGRVGVAVTHAAAERVHLRVTGAQELIERIAIAAGGLPGEMLFVKVSHRPAWSTP